MKLTEILNEAKNLADSHFKLSNGSDAYAVLTFGGYTWENCVELRAPHLNLTVQLYGKFNPNDAQKMLNTIVRKIQQLEAFDLGKVNMTGDWSLARAKFKDAYKDKIREIIGTIADDFKE